MQRDFDTLTPLDARNSLLTKPAQTQAFTIANTGLSDTKRSLPPSSRGTSPDRYYSTEPAGYAAPPPPLSLAVNNGYRPLTPSMPAREPVEQGRDMLIPNAAPLGRMDGRRPTLPNLGYGDGPTGGFALANSGYAPAPLYGGGRYNNSGYGGPNRGPPSRGGY